MTVEKHANELIWGGVFIINILVFEKKKLIDEAAEIKEEVVLESEKEDKEAKAVKISKLWEHDLS